MSSSKRSKPARCADCFLPQGRCICHDLPQFQTGISFLIIRHKIEAYQGSNTGRLAEAVLEECKIHDYGVQGAPFDESVIPKDAWLLFPPEQDKDSQETGRHTLLEGPVHPLPSAFIVLDATWSQARRMSRRIRALDALPRFQLSPSAKREVVRLRRAPVPGAVSTLEAIAQVLETYGNTSVADSLHEVYRDFASRLRKGDWGDARKARLLREKRLTEKGTHAKLGESLD